VTLCYPAPPKEMGTVRLCSFRHMSTPPCSVSASRASFITVFCNLLHHTSRLSTIRVALNVKQRTPTLFPVLQKPEVVFKDQTVADRSISIYNLSCVCLRCLSADIGHAPNKPPSADSAPCQNGRTPGCLQWSDASIGRPGSAERCSGLASA